MKYYPAEQHEGYCVEEPVSDVSMASPDSTASPGHCLPTNLETMPVNERVKRCSISPKKHNTRFSANVQRARAVC